LAGGVKACARLALGFWRRAVVVQRCRKRLGCSSDNAVVQTGALSRHDANQHDLATREKGFWDVVRLRREQSLFGAVV